VTIAQGLTTSFKQEMLQGTHNLLTDTLRMALYSDSASIGATTTAYTTTGEITGTGYTAGGQVVTGASISASTDGVVFVDFNDVAWSSASFTARGALIYNSSKSNKSVAVIDFGSNKTSSSTFTVIMPVNAYTTALIRFP